MYVVKTAFLALAFSLFAGLANATLVDFTDGSVWGTGSVPSPKTVSYGDLDVTLTAYSDYPTSTDYTNRLEGGCSIAGLVCQTDGIGIRDDEVTWHSGGMYDGELITVEFSKAVDINWIGFLDLFDETGGKEVAQLVATYADSSRQGNGYEADQPTGTKGWFQGTADNGLKSVQNFLTGVIKLEFFADRAGSLSGPSNSDFALAAIQVASVSEPATIGLLLLGLVALIGARRRMR